jgi:hypothetical protein
MGNGILVAFGTPGETRMGGAERRARATDGPGFAGFSFSGGGIAFGEVGGTWGAPFGRSNS